MKDINGALEFLEKNKVLFLDWLRKTSPDFPYSCSFASEVLSSYLQEKYNVGECTFGRYKEPNRGHSWVEIEDTIVDFTLFQFVFGKDDLSEEMSAEELYQKFITDIQGSFIIGEVICDMFYSDFRVEPRYKGLVQSDNFEKYLQLVADEISVHPYTWRNAKHKNNYEEALC